MNEKKDMGFIQGAMIIALANIIVKVIGAIYKIPLDRFVLETDGMTLYNTSYTIYNLLFVISTAGLPTAISKLTAEANSSGDYEKSNKILKVSFGLLCTLGFAGMMILLFGAKFFSRLVGYPDAVYTMMAMSPSLLFVGCMSSFRGYFQGHKNMVPTAVSEVIEALGKLFIGLSLAYILLPYGKPMASAGAILGITVGSMAGAIFLFLYYLKKRDKTFKKTGTTVKSKSVLFSIVKIAVPITIGVSVFTLTSFIDTAMVSNQMKSYINVSEAATGSFFENMEEGKMEEYLAIEENVREKYTGFTEEKIEEKMAENRAAFIYGYLVRAITLFNMPAVIIAAIATSIVPAIASENAKGNKGKSQSYTKSALIITAVLALPCAVGMSVLANPIFKLIYGDGSFSSLLGIMGLAVVFLTLVQIENAILQSWGKVWIPVLNMLIGGAVKILVNLVLVGKPEINIMGAPIGTLLCYFVVVTLNLIFIVRCTKTKVKITEFCLKPVLCTILMGIITYVTYGLISRYAGLTVSLAGSILISVAAYFTFVILTKTLRKDEILLLPKGEAILRMMEKRHLV